MRKPLLILLPAAALLAAGAAWHHQSRQSDRSHTSYKTDEAAAPPQDKAPASLTLSPATPKPEVTPPDRILTDAPAIFKKAFWRDPSPEDHIAHAERREWRDGEGVTRWEWYLEVNASPGLLKYLREENAFGLLPATPRASDKPGTANVPVIAKTPPPAAAIPALPENRPEWFQFNPADTDIFQSRTGKLRLYFSKTDNKLYASNAGQGFQRGAAAPASAAAAAEMPAASATPAPPSGRLPTTPPPIPSP
jgi:hypothetical protein